MRPDGHRRKWDRKEYEKMARLRDHDEREYDWEDDEEIEFPKDNDGPPVKRSLLKRRDYKVDLDSKLGKSTVITKNTPSAAQGG